MPVQKPSSKISTPYFKALNKIIKYVKLTKSQSDRFQDIDAYLAGKNIFSLQNKVDLLTLAEAFMTLCDPYANIIDIQKAYFSISSSASSLFYLEQLKKYCHSKALDHSVALEITAQFINTIFIALEDRLLAKLTHNNTKKANHQPHIESVKSNFQKSLQLYLKLYTKDDTAYSTVVTFQNNLAFDAINIQLNALLEQLFNTTPNSIAAIAQILLTDSYINQMYNILTKSSIPTANKTSHAKASMRITNTAKATTNKPKEKCRQEQPTPGQ